VFWSRCIVHSGWKTIRETDGRHASRRFASVHLSLPKHDRMSTTSIHGLPAKSEVEL
jgi:hypothetical protein